MRNQLPHLLYATITDAYGRLEFKVECPYMGTGPRSCLMIEEVTCQQYLDQGWCDLEEEGLAGYNDATGHGHGIDGCAVVQYVDVGIEDGFIFIGNVEVRWPMKVAVVWGGDGDYIELRQWKEDDAVGDGDGDKDGDGDGDGDEPDGSDRDGAETSGSGDGNPAAGDDAGGDVPEL